MPNMPVSFAGLRMCQCQAQTPRSPVVRGTPSPQPWPHRRVGDRLHWGWPDHLLLARHRSLPSAVALPSARSLLRLRRRRPANAVAVKGVEELRRGC
jgi:hypothetical protein